ncbi:MAG: hypothetical protein JO034_30480 [Singulisphaera sp.]|nr:hypothetical protein [Singulisphaera sp.]
MRRRFVWSWILIAGSLGAAPAAPSYLGIERSIASARNELAKPGTAQPNAPGWNAFFDALTNELRAYANAPTDNDRLVSLNRLYQMSVALGSVSWPPALQVREELRNWLRPRVRLAWAERQLRDTLRNLGLAPSPAVQDNRRRWVVFVDDALGSALHDYEVAPTVAQRQAALKRVYDALNALQAGNQSRPWVPSLALESALNDLYNRPNLDITADLVSVEPALSKDVVETGPIVFKGYLSYVTAGPKTGFGLLPSDDGIAFYNKQMLTSVTPIHDFQQQIERDRRGRRAAKLYYFNATSEDQSEVTITAVIRDTGLQLIPDYLHNVDAMICSLQTQGHSLGRFVASLVGFNQQRITQEVYTNALPRIQQNVQESAAELGQIRTTEEAEKRSATFRQYLIGNHMLAFRNLLITGLSLRSRPEYVLVGGTLQWRGGAEQVGADAPQPVALANPEPGVTADVHLTSIMSSLTRGYLQSDAVRSLDNLMIVTRKVPPGAPPSQGVVTSQNVDYPTYLRAVREARAVNDPKVLAIRVKRPGRAPEFAADASGYLVAIIHDFVIDLPAPAQAVRGGMAGPPAQVYRISAPEAEVRIAFKVEPATQTNPVRLSGRIEGFDFGPNTRVFGINEDESKAAPLTAFTGTFVLGVFRGRVQGQPIDLPLSNLQLRGFAIRSVSPLDPSGWIRANLVRTSTSPAAGLQ